MGVQIRLLTQSISTPDEIYEYKFCDVKLHFRTNSKYKIRQHGKLFTMSFRQGNLKLSELSQEADIWNKQCLKLAAIQSHSRQTDLSGGNLKVP